MSSQRNQGGIVRIKELAMHVKHKVNLLGVVLEFSIPRKSQGTGKFCVFLVFLQIFFFFWFVSFWVLFLFFFKVLLLFFVDYVCVLKIVDDSQQSPELLVNIFTSSIDQLPRVLSPRDLILLKNVMVLL